MGIQCLTRGNFLMFVGCCRVLAAFFFAAAMLTGCSMDSNDSGGSGGADSSGSAASIGQPVRDGKFEFVVTKVDNLGGVINVHLQVTNIGNEAQYFSSGNQKLLAGGKTFESDMWESSGTTMDELNPGLSAQGVLAFKVPPGTVPDAVELHDSMFSQGAKVNL